MGETVNIAIVGCGRVGEKRALAAAAGGHRIVAAADQTRALAERLAAPHAGCEVATDARAAIDRGDVDIVIVATTNDALAPITLASIERGKHVLVEKPAARSVAEIDPVLRASERQQVVVKVGFNHRFHPAMQKARELFDSGVAGPLMYIRARYGHGGRLGYEREWRADPEIAGGGELIDQGVHLIDLAGWFAGEFTDVAGRIDTFFWPMPVDDNAFLQLRTAGGQVAWLHASCTEWKNLFSFEVFCRDGKFQIDGLGGSYGLERLTFYRMRPEMGPPETTSWEYPGPDESWRAEIDQFVSCITTGRAPLGSLEDAKAALAVMDHIYAQHGLARDGFRGSTLQR